MGAHFSSKAAAIFHIKTLNVTHVERVFKKHIAIEKATSVL